MKTEDVVTSIGDVRMCEAKRRSVKRRGGWKESSIIEDRSPQKNRIHRIEESEILIHYFFFRSLPRCRWRGRQADGSGRMDGRVDISRMSQSVCLLFITGTSTLYRYEYRVDHHEEP
jgi:hypothetical protein